MCLVGETEKKIRNRIKRSKKRKLTKTAWDAATASELQLKNRIEKKIKEIEKKKK